MGSNAIRGGSFPTKETPMTALPLFQVGISLQCTTMQSSSPNIKEYLMLLARTIIPASTTSSNFSKKTIRTLPTIPTVLLPSNTRQTSTFIAFLQTNVTSSMQVLTQSSALHFLWPCRLPSRVVSSTAHPTSVRCHQMGIFDHKPMPLYSILLVVWYFHGLLQEGTCILEEERKHGWEGIQHNLLHPIQATFALRR